MGVPPPAFSVAGLPNLIEGGPHDGLLAQLVERAPDNCAVAPGL